MDTIDGYFRRPGHTTRWLSVIAGAIFLGGMVILAALVAGNIWVLVLGALIALVVSTIAMSRLQTQIVAVSLEPGEALTISGPGYDLTLPHPVVYQTGYSPHTRRLWLYLDQATLSLEERLDGSEPPPEMASGYPPEGDYRVLISTQTYPGTVWFLIQALGE